MRMSVLVAGLSLLAGPALAHAFLQHAAPGAGAELKAAPTQITLDFSEKLEPTFSGVSVTDAQGRDMEARPAKIADSNMTVTLKPLAQGRYHVAWHAVSTDSHRTEGSYSFEVETPE